MGLYTYRIFVPGHGYTRSLDWSTNASAALIAERKRPDAPREKKIGTPRLLEKKPTVDILAMLPLGPPPTVAEMIAWPNSDGLR